jgi:hypothetical protein
MGSRVIDRITRAMRWRVIVPVHDEYGPLYSFLVVIETPWSVSSSVWCRILDK